MYSADEIAALLPHMTPEERAFTMDALSPKVWRPLIGETGTIGPQAMAYYSEADILGYGGAAGGGKTDLACGLALTKHKKTLIVRRESTQLRQIEDRLATLIGNRNGLNSQQGLWRLPDRQVEFGSTPNPGDEQKYQGRDHDLKVFDEATGQREAQVRFLLGWLRTDDPSQRTRAILTFNPPQTAEGRWVVSFFAPWLDDKHPNPAKPGELRWFATIGGKDREMADARAFVLGDDDEPIFDFDPADYTGPNETKVIRPLSRTFIPSRVTDNPYYMRTGYARMLQGLPEPLRSQMLNGDFQAGIEDDPWQVIPTAWVDLAMARWQPRVSDKRPMDSVGVDVARGGRDETIISRRHGRWFDEMLAFSGAATIDGPAVFSEVVRVRRDKAPVHVDVIGVGSSPYDLMRSNGIQTIPVNGSESSGDMNREATMAFANKRAELWWKMREALDPDQGNRIDLPPDQKLRADLCAPLWKLTTGGIQIERKDEIIKRIGRSPDRGDAACMALISTRKLSDVRHVPKRRGSAWAA